MLQNVKSTLKCRFSHILAYLPTKLPIGMTEYHAWLASILELAGPIADKMSMEWVVSNEVMVIKSGQDRVPKMFFVKRLRKFAANQLAASYVNQLKEQQKAVEEAAKAAATAKEVAGNGVEKN
jgi:hypothetical protein